MPASLFAYSVFALVMSITPGPNNIMVSASGANFGFTRTVPHMLGIAFGFPPMLAAVAMAMGQLRDLFPVLGPALTVASAGYLLILAWRIATVDRAAIAAGRAQPLSFLQAALFQWINPKAWLIALAAVSTYRLEAWSVSLQVTAMSGIFIAACIPSVALWTALGSLAGRWLQSDSAMRTFNRIMAGLLVGSLALAML